MRARLWLLGTVVALGSAAHAQVAAKGGGYLFRVKLAAGTTVRYDTAISISLSGRPGKFTLPMTRKTVKVRKNVADLVISEGPLRFNGNPLGQVATLRMSINSLGSAVGGKVTANAGVTQFPKTPIRPGYVWTASLPLSMGTFAGDGSTIVAAYRFVKMTAYHGKRAAELNVSITKPGGRIPLTGTGKMYILASDGNILHTSMKFSVQTQKDMEPASVTAEVSRS